MIRVVLSTIASVIISAVPLLLALLGGIFGLAGLSGLATLCFLLAFAAAVFIVLLWGADYRWRWVALTVVLSLVGLILLTVVFPALASG